MGETKLLLHKKNTPDYCIDSPYIMSGYRHKLSVYECLISMFSWHNQTMNIWSSVILIGINLYMTYSLTLQHKNMPPYGILFFWGQGILRSYCWFNSWLYHTFVCHSKNVAKTLCVMDYLGCYLTPLGMGSNLMFIQLQCYPVYLLLFMSLGSIGIGFALTISILPHYQTETYRIMRLYISLFTSFPYLIGLSASIVVIHNSTVPTFYVYFAYAVMFESTAGFFYITMIPEIIFPYYFDNILSSHSIWHWLNIGFDVMMMYLAIESFKHIEQLQIC